ncbi:hypothetical protein RM697_01765 [Ichthyenterobacterium sp. W332]|uniref:SGNH/GDSL hydrolase family protein n=1 Tax=Microcosmobacter mediterraneus TaxID=3075607 RepID=A0ABU2YHU7_9FLAO|nr:hypothetical protein [Ichthyenterobacterium sp. W332]MDT0557355.1 hypothetical protein [Ichthyenterobacterium sp. W332]
MYNEYDYIILGSSTGLTTINTIQIDSLIKTKGVNLSMDDTAMSTQYLMLQHFLVEGHTTKLCIISPSNSAYNTLHTKLNTNDYRFLSHIDRPYVYDYYEQFNDSESKILSVSKWLPFVGVGYYNAELFYPSLLSAIKPIRKNKFDEYGNYTYPNNTNAKNFITQKVNMDINFSNPYLNKILKLCNDNNIKLIYYISPMKDKSVKIKETYNSIINHSNVLKTSNLFYDNIHVTKQGREKCSSFLAKELKAMLNN